jgi:inositol transport system ATP-binding protein
MSAAVGPGPARAIAHELLLEVVGVSKQFPGVQALADVSLQLRAGSVHALMGENGAGKSTLMKIIAGVIEPSSGEIRVRGIPCRFTRPRDALDRGIAMIHQELNLVPHMTIAENIWVGRELRRLGFIDHGALRRRTQALLDALGIALDAQTRVSDLPVANQQMVEIAKAVSQSSDVLIMDEPTSSLTEREVGQLFRIVRQLRDAGKAIIYITHKMSEVFAIADEVSVFRDGRHVATAAASAFTQDRLISLMVGRELTQMFPKATVPIGEVVLSVRDLALAGVFADVSFELRRGEILGVAGLIGAGRTNVAETLYGVTPATGGEIAIDGQRVAVRSPRDAMRHGMALLTEDRKQSGLFLVLSVLENMQVASVDRFSARTGFVRQAPLAALCADMCGSLRIKTPGLGETIENLSGGNQQKVLIARWLMTEPRILILDEPTRGIDVGAKSQIHQLISNLAAKGLAILMISSELPEILGMSDRVMVMHAGRVSGILDRSDATQERIMELAAR